MRPHIAAGKHFFEVAHKRRVDRHEIFEIPVNGAFLGHVDLSIALDDLRLDLAYRLILQNAIVDLAVNDLLANFGDALRAQRISLAWPAKRRLGLLPALQQRLLRPFWGEGWVLLNLIQLVEDIPCNVSGDCNRFFDVFNWFVHSFLFLTRGPVSSSISDSETVNCLSVVSVSRESQRKNTEQW